MDPIDDLIKELNESTNATDAQVKLGELEDAVLLNYHESGAVYDTTLEDFEKEVMAAIADTCEKFNL